MGERGAAWCLRASCELVFHKHCGERFADWHRRLDMPFDELRGEARRAGFSERHNHRRLQHDGASKEQPGKRSRADSFARLVRVDFGDCPKNQIPIARIGLQLDAPLRLVADRVLPPDMAAEKKPPRFDLEACIC